MVSPSKSQWESLFDQAVAIINQANREFKLVDDWSFGGGTALMLQIEQRESFDVDIFIDDPQLLPYLNPQVQGYTLDLNPDDYETDGTKALKIVFAGVGEIDFICAPALTDYPTTMVPVRGVSVALETPAEIVAKKIYHRGSSMQPRDMFDIACIVEAFGEQCLLDALAPLKERAAVALEVAEKMDHRLAKTLMGSLLFRENFSHIPSQGRAITIKLLEAVCAYDPASTNKVGTTPSPK